MVEFLMVINILFLAVLLKRINNNLKRTEEDMLSRISEVNIRVRKLEGKMNK